MDRKLMHLLIAIAFIVVPACLAFELRTAYTVVVKRSCTTTAKGELLLNRDYGLYSFLNTENEPVANGTFEFNDDGKLVLSEPLDVWGRG